MYILYTDLSFYAQKMCVTQVRNVFIVSFMALYYV